MAAAPGPCPARSRRTGIVSTISATVTVCRSQLMTTPGRGRGLLRGPRPCNWKGCLLPAPFTRLPAKDRETVTPNSFSESYTSVITLPGVILARFRSLWCRRDSVCLPITIGQLIMRDGPAMRSPGASGARGSDPPGHEEETPPASRAGADHGPYTGSGVVSLVPGCVSSARADRDAGLCGLVGAAWPRAAHLGVPARLARTGRSSRPCRRTAHRFDGLYWSGLTLLAW